MARYFLELRLTGLRNRLLALREEPNRAAPVVIGIMLVVFVPSVRNALMDVVDVMASAGTLPNAAETLPFFSFFLVMGWILLPLGGLGGGQFSVANFRLLPVTPRQLTDGSIVARVVSPATVIGAIYIGLLLSGFDVAAWRFALMVMAAVVLIAICVVASRITIVAVDALARRRRGREALVAITLPISLLPLLFLVVMFRDPQGESGLAPVLGWLPTGWPGRSMGAAAEGRTAEALVFLAASIGLVVAVRLLLIALTRRALFGEDRSNESVHAVDDPFDHFARRLPASRAAAVAAASVRQLIRNPVKVSQSIVGSLLFAGMFTALGVALLTQVAPRYAPLGVIGLTFGPLARRLNEIGDSGAAYWMEVLAPGPTRSGLIGRDLAALPLDVPLFAVITIAVGVATRDLTLVPAALAFLAGATAVTYTIGRFSSVFFPSGLESVSDEKTQSQAQPSRLATVPAILAIFALVATPSGLLIWRVVIDGSALAVAIASATMMLYGLVIYLAGLWFLGRWLDTNQPKLLAKVGG